MVVQDVPLALGDGFEEILASMPHVVEVALRLPVGS
jgi:hypothetical protein